MIFKSVYLPPPRQVINNKAHPLLKPLSEKYPQYFCVGGRDLKADIETVILSAYRLRGWIRRFNVNVFSSDNTRYF